MFRVGQQQRRSQNVLELLIYTIILIFSKSANGKNTDFGPSILSFSHDTIIPGVQNYPKIIYLDDFPGYSTVLPLVQNRTWASTKDLFKDGMSGGNVTFLVQVPIGLKIMAVIQDLYLGHSEHSVLSPDSSENKGSSCRHANFIKISDPTDPSLSITTCGDVNATDMEVTPENLIGPRLFRSSSNIVEFSIQLGNHKSTPHQRTKYALEDSIINGHYEEIYRLSISLTAFEDCSDFSKSTLGLGSLVPCHPNPQVVSPCINSNLLCSGVLNCAMTQPDLFALDERFCYKTLQEKQKAFEQLRRKSTLIWIFKARNSETWAALNDPSQSHLESSDSVAKPQNSSSGNGNQNQNPKDYADHHTTLTPPNAILAIMFLIVTVMILGSIIRFCCTKCVGEPIPPPSAEENGESVDNFVNIFGLAGIQISPNQSRVDFQKDLPPSYEDLFPVPVPTEKGEDPQGGNKLDGDGLSQDVAVAATDNLDLEEDQNTKISSLNSNPES